MLYKSIQNAMKTKIKYISLLSILAITFVGCGRESLVPVDRGVSLQLAQHRKAIISKPEYKLHIIIPKNRDKKIIGKEEILFLLQNTTQDLQIDFRESSSNIKSVICNEKVCDYSYEKEHLIIPANYLKTGTNSIKIEFIVGNTSLNRNHEFLYTLFVPDRARTAFPCFDQPDLKAVFNLQLDVPKDWIAIANGKTLAKTENDGYTSYKFDVTKPIPTYLFSFVAGKFQTVKRAYKGREHTFYHRETNKEKLDNNIDEIFSLLFNSLDWLEEYTGMNYPFGKYDLIGIPSFQYNGMEHIGATLYNSTGLILDKNASQSKLLRRANLIAHETAHMWFGNLVTMKWFDQVWIKEVFASYMADKMIKQNFPGLNHELSFLMGHYPSAYNIDRTQGANSINQQLDNLKDAGTLYGNIIYHKAPIIMKMLENIIGEETLRKSLHKYLIDYSYSNATWEDLIAIIDSEAGIDLKDWNRIWVNEPNRPHLCTTIKTDPENKIDELTINQTDYYRNSKNWSQNLSIILGDENGFKKFSIDINGAENKLEFAVGELSPEFIILNGRGNGYGYFELDNKTKSYLLKNVSDIEDELLRGICWINLWENLIEGNIESKDLIEAIILNLPEETSTLNIERILPYLTNIYWLYLTDIEREQTGNRVENLLWALIEKTDNLRLKGTYFNYLITIAKGESTLSKLNNIWDGKLKIKNLHISEQQYTALAQDLAIKMEDKSEYLLQTQLNRITNPDFKKRFEFIMPALSSDSLVRDKFFENLRNPVNRENERWVAMALKFIHHPLRTEHSVKYILPSLEMLPEIQKTGDIFFPIHWLESTYSGHNSLEAKIITLDFLAAHPNFPDNLKMKILQSADKVLRNIR
jgi:aminopeptidase N